MGGEEGVIRIGYSAFCGLPPRGRGRDRRWRKHLLFAGITPAWAGKRFEAARKVAEREDYPRVGGEETD